MLMIRSFTRPTFLLAGLSATALWAAACSAPPAAPPSPVAPTMASRVAHRDTDLGVPTFVWIDAQPAPNSDANTVAWQTLRELAPTYGLDSQALQAARLNRVHDTGRGA